MVLIPELFLLRPLNNGEAPSELISVLFAVELDIFLGWLLVLTLLGFFDWSNLGLDKGVDISVGDGVGRRPDNVFLNPAVVDRAVFPLFYRFFTALLPPFW